MFRRPLWVLCLMVAVGQVQAQEAVSNTHLSGQWVGLFSDDGFDCVVTTYINQHGTEFTGISYADFRNKAGQTMHGTASVSGRVGPDRQVYMSEDALIDTVLLPGLILELADFHLKLSADGTELKGYFQVRERPHDKTYMTLKRSYGLPSLKDNKAYFEPASSDLPPGERAKVDRLAAVLKADSSLKVELMGFTDFSKNFARLKALAEARARAVGVRLQQQGVDPRRITVGGYGYQAPEEAATGYNKVGDPRNRRVEFRLYRN
jgi:outer membrane protein OmpA-like peptidoglycan-associated protein